jgi:hypothetical protein
MSGIGIRGSEAECIKTSYHFRHQFSANTGFHDHREEYNTLELQFHAKIVAEGAYLGTRDMMMRRSLDLPATESILFSTVR